MLFAAAGQSFNRSYRWAPIGLKYLLLLSLVSACSAAGSSQQSTPGASSQPSMAQPAAPPPAALAPNPGSAANAVAAPSAAGAPPAQEHIVGVGSATVVTVHGKIVSVNRSKKVVTLEGPTGKKVTVHVYNPYNLASAKAGEPFIAKFYEIVTVSKIRGDVAPPKASLTEGIVSAAPGQTPGATAGATIRMSVVVEATNKNKETISIRGPDGSTETVKVANPAYLEHIKVGDEIVVTLTNAVSIWLEKETEA